MYEEMVERLKLIDNSIEELKNELNITLGRKAELLHWMQQQPDYESKGTKGSKTASTEDS